MPYSYPSTQVGQVTINNFSTSAETDILVINDQKTLLKSVLTFYYNVSMGSATEIDFRYYVSNTYRNSTSSYVSTDWFQIPGRSSGTISVVTDGYLKVTSTLSFVDVLSTGNNTGISVSAPAMSALKVTGKGVGSATASTTLTAMVRDN